MYTWAQILLVSGKINNDKIQFIHINMKICIHVISYNHSREFKTEFWIVKDLNHLKKNTTAVMILFNDDILVLGIRWYSTAAQAMSLYF